MFAILIATNKLVVQSWLIIQPKMAIKCGKLDGVNC